MQQIQWYPGHMTKARRMIEANLKLIDVVIEVVDARAPCSSRNPDFDELFCNKPRFIILNKADLADEKMTVQWKTYYEGLGYRAIPFISIGSNVAKAKELIAGAVKDKAQRQKQKGISMVTRALVAGIPNVGKSTFINCIAGSANAQTGDKPGVTKGKQWIKASPYLELMDTPGLLWPKFMVQAFAKRLAYLGSIRDEILGTEELALELLAFLKRNYFAALCARYKKITEQTPDHELLGEVCRSRGFLSQGGLPDTERAAATVLDEFRAAKIARVTLESPAVCRAEQYETE